MILRLRDIRWLGAPQEYLELMLPLIVSPALTNFRLGLGTYDDLNASQVVPALEALAPAYNSLVEMRFCGDSIHDPQIIHAASHLLLKCNPDTIRHFRVVSALSAQAFIHTTQLQTCSRLLSWRARSSSACHLPTTVFPSLKFLEIDAIDTRSPLLKTIAHIQSRTFAGLELKFPATTLETFLPTLTVLLINPEGDFDLDGATVQPILSLNQLTHLEITPVCGRDRCPYKLSDQDIEGLVTAMPRLEQLSLGPFPCSQPANNTIKTLISTAKHCKRLEQLVIHTNVGAIVAGVFQGGDRGEDPAPKDRLSPDAPSKPNLWPLFHSERGTRRDDICVDAASVVPSSKIDRSSPSDQRDGSAMGAGRHYNHHLQTYTYRYSRRR